MADIDFDDYGGIPRFSGEQARRLVNVAGAVCSLGLVAGLGFWGYNLAVRDVSGVPVIRAAAEPMRIAPSNPGGEIADHQGMAVNAVPELRGSEEMPEEIVLAPAPVELSLDDMPGLVSLAASAEAEAAPENPAPLTVSATREAVLEVVASAATASEVVTTDDAIALALAEALGGDVALSTEVAVEADQSLTPSEEQVLASIRPMPRPGRSTISDVEPLAAAAAGAVPTANEIDPATLAVGTRLVQLGAFDSVDQARGEWTKLTARFGDLMSGKSIVIQDAESGGRTFYRLRAHGFDGEDDARRFCAALLAEDAACIPVAHR